MTGKPSHSREERLTSYLLFIYLLSICGFILLLVLFTFLFYCKPLLLAYRFLTPWLEDRVGLRDTCGVHNLHGMPGLLGGLAAALVAFTMPVRNKAVMAHSTNQVSASYIPVMAMVM